MTMGSKIQLCRKQAGFSQEALAVELGISRQAVSRWETGEAVPDTERVIQLSRLFHVTTDYLLLDEIETTSVPAAEQPAASAKVSAPTDPPVIQLDQKQMNDRALQERRRQLRIFFAKSTLFGGFLAIVATLVGTGFYARELNSWITSWGRYGTALLDSWLIHALIISVCIFLMGISLLIVEYRRTE